MISITCLGVQGYASLMLMTLEEGHPQHEQLMESKSMSQSGANLTRQLFSFADASGTHKARSTDSKGLLRTLLNQFARKEEIDRRGFMYILVRI